MAIHNFKQSLELSHSYSDASWWEEVYRKAFYNFDSMTDCRNDGWWQRAGIDRQVHLKNSKSISIDEKVRTQVYSDILLERWSDADRKVAGWVQKDLACDYIAYAFVPIQTCYLLDFKMLRKAWIENGRFWISKYGSKFANNGRYKTESIPVPISILLESIKNASVINW